MLIATLKSITLLLSGAYIGAGFDANPGGLDTGNSKSAKYSFETLDELKNWRTEKSQISLSGDHYKHGQMAMQWDYQAGGSLSVSDAQSMDIINSSRAGSGVKVWIYSEKEQNGFLRIEGRAGDKIAWQFDSKLQFKGWRAIWLRPSEDAKCLIPAAKIEQIRFVANTLYAGRLFIDRLEFSDTVLWVREADFQAAVNVFRNGGPDETLRIFRQTPPLDNVAPSNSEIAAVDVITHRLNDWLKGSSAARSLPEIAIFKENLIKSAPVILKKFGSFKIQRHVDGNLTGEPLFAICRGGFPQIQSLLTDCLLPMTLLYSYQGSLSSPNTYYHSKELLDKIILALDFANDQGWAAGSSMGTCYDVTLLQSGFNSIIFMLREELAQAKIFERELQTAKYYSHFNDLFNSKLASSVHVADDLRSVALFQLILVCAMSDKNEQVKYLRLYTQSINSLLATSSGPNSFIKPDGTVYHHLGPYWLYYGNNAMEMAARIGYWLRGTPFALNENSRQNLKLALLSSRWVSQKYDLPVSLNGRWPFFKDGLVQSIFSFAYLASWGDSVDIELVAAFNRIYDVSHPAIKRWISEIKYDNITFTSTAGSLEYLINFAKFYQNIPAEATPKGNLALPYAAADFHRRGETLVSIKGNSRYIWDWEYLSVENQLGRYLSSGSIFIYTGNMLKSGFNWRGWDWSHIPGTTTLALPLAKLDPVPINDDSRHFTDQAAVGPLSFGDNGAFMMRFHDTTYDASCSFDQSVFCIDQTVLCLGNAISNSNNEYPTHTTIFQRILPSAESYPTIVDGKRETSLDYAKSFNGGSLLLRDSRNTGYYFPDAAKLKVFRQKQSYPLNKFGRDTGGDNLVELAYLDHGISPKNAGYEYAILIEGAEKPVDYRVLRKDSIAHVVKFPGKNLTVSAIFVAGQTVNELIAKVSEPALLAVTEKDGNCEITAAAVDFGKNWRPEISSQTWFSEIPQNINFTNAPNQLKITLNGQYCPASGLSTQIAVNFNHNKTEIDLAAVDGTASKIQLLKIE